jgi:hypothetical protein
MRNAYSYNKSSQMLNMQTLRALNGIEQSVTLRKLGPSSISKHPKYEQRTVSPNPGDIKPLAVKTGSTAATHIYTQCELPDSSVALLGVTSRPGY